MAKKRASNVQGGEKPLQKQEDTVKPHQQPVTPAMESEASEKIDSLKSLNQMLLKEMVERRQQVESLVQSKGFLETELARSNAERDALRSELARLGENVAEMELERGVVVDFVAAQVGMKGEDVGRVMKGLELEMAALRSDIGEKESEIGRLSGRLSEVEGVLKSEKEVSRRIHVERDGLKNELDLQIQEIRMLKESLSALEQRKGEMNGRIKELQVDYDGVVHERDELALQIESLVKEKDSAERSLEELNKLEEGLSEKIRAVVREKELIEEAKNEEMVRRKELESVVSSLNETVISLRKEEEKLRANLAVLERKSNEGQERQKALRRELDELVEEKKLCERKVEVLVVEKAAIEEGLGEAVGKLDEQKVKIEELVRAKIVIEEAKAQLDDEVGALQNQVAELNAVVSKLEELNWVGVEKIRGLESEVGEYRSKLQVVESERHEMENQVLEEKAKAVALKGLIGELEIKIEEGLNAAGKAKAENAAILAAKAELESEHEMLNKKITSLENALLDARNELDSMKGKAELVDAKSEQVLNMLKETVAFCSKDENSMEEGDFIVDKYVNDEEAKAYVKELEGIKNAFKSKVSKLDNMRRQLESLQNSVEEAHKKKGFWTMLSSATTLLAAISIAYVARGH